MKLRILSGRGAMPLLGLAGLVSAASATLLTDPNDARTWQGAGVGTFAALVHGSDTLATRTQVINDGLLDDGVFDQGAFGPATLMHTTWSDNVGTGGLGRSLDLTGTGGYDYVIDGSSVFTHANTAIDNLWFQSSGTVGDTVFDLGGMSSHAAVFAAVDHGPLPQETIESTVYLSNDLTTWTQASLKRVYLEGYMLNTGIQWDGFCYIVGTANNSFFRYASIIHGGPGALLSDGDDEISGMMGLTGVPEPGTMAALGVGVAALLRRRRKQA